ncbi:hypothetical protein B0H13DRAFT_1879984 [Mycena leptocephala]|nr:hypothetical protein B0H13DRAFT_1879984 [Mycena leptocephala]
MRTPVDEFGVHNLARSRSVGGPGGASVPGEAGYGAVGFLPTMATLPDDLHVPWAHSSSTPARTILHLIHQLQRPPLPFRRPDPAAYSLLSPVRGAMLGLADAARLVGTVCTELERTGVATPFAFTALTLDVRRAGVVRLANAFLATCRDSSASSSSNARAGNNNSYSDSNGGRGIKGGGSKSGAQRWWARAACRAPRRIFGFSSIQPGGGDTDTSVAFPHVLYPARVGPYTILCPYRTYDVPMYDILRVVLLNMLF